MIVQFAVAAGAVWISGVGFTGIQLGSSRVAFHPLLVYILTIGRFVLCTNAINWFDGVYGLASGSSSI